ncbi:uncharacterized protein Bfra_005479 [Botrytis fragariae]|uniref:Uncharacterized protein n=1 Tax=Botrytis fragariae TaxID=1964551 RepID=A0A8H6AUR4_9HELO|nr:uncharacterized protein Bfra_005479 [Botrytis fragariae]KAF5874012.1 hypothetical protein Bfra_005479 [Botrytis fragariae]
MPYQLIPFEIIVRGEMNILPSIESMPTPFDEISGSFGMTKIVGTRCLALGVQPALLTVKKYGLFQEEPAALVVEIAVRQPSDTIRTKDNLEFE